MLNLDTHIVLDLLRGELSARERVEVEKEEICVSAIVLWEIAKLASLRRIEMDLDHPGFLAFVGSVRTIPIDFEIARKSTQLDFKSDPADEIIAATSWALGIPLMTRDRRIRESRKIRFVPR